MSSPNSDPLHQRTIPLYQKDSHTHTHTSPITSFHPLNSLPEETRNLFKSPQSSSTPIILTTSSTIFHAQGGGQPSDTGTITSSSSGSTFNVYQVRRPADSAAILHLGVFDSPDSQFTAGESCIQAIDVPKRILHSRIHTAGHVIGLAVNQLVKEGALDKGLKDGKASHYPGAAFVEFTGLIPGDAKPLIQSRVDEFVSNNLSVHIHFWSPAHAQQHCTGVSDIESLKGDEDGVRVVEIGDVGSYPCGGTHVDVLSECGRIVVRGIKRQKGVSKIGYEVADP